MHLSLASALPSDPLAAIRGLTKCERELESMRFDAVKRAREAGRSWEDIATALGVSRQSAWQYYAPRFLKEVAREEVAQPEISIELAMNLAESETREVRRRRRLKTSI